MPAVIMYFSRNCPYCERAEKLLKSKGVKIRRINVEGNPARLKEMIRRSRRKTVPQIYIGDKHVGGFDDLAKLDKIGRLDVLLEG